MVFLNIKRFSSSACAMVDENQIKKFRENPELFRLYLLNSFKECTAGIKQLMKGTVLDKGGLPEYLEETLIKSLDENLKTAFQKFDLDTSMRKLRELEENASGEAAWRPKTGVVDLSGEKKHYLLKRKKLLEAKTKQIDSEIEAMKVVITEKRNNLKVHLAELQKRMAGLDNIKE